MTEASLAPMPSLTPMPDNINENSYMIGGIGILLIFFIMWEIKKSRTNNNDNKDVDKKQLQNRYFDPKIVRLFIGTIMILLILGSISFYLYNQDNGEAINNIETGATLFRKIGLWLNNNPIPSTGTTIDNLTMKQIMAGMAFGIIFGFIDNAGLFFGMDALDPYVKKWFGTDAKVAAGVGNTFSDVIGAFAGSFAGSIVQHQLKKDLPDCYESPLWAEAIGIFIGCVLGIIGPKLIVG